MFVLIIDIYEAARQSRKDYCKASLYSFERIPDTSNQKLHYEMLPANSKKWPRLM